MHRACSLLPYLRPHHKTFATCVEAWEHLCTATSSHIVMQQSLFLVIGVFLSAVNSE